MPFKNPPPLYSCWCGIKSRCNNPKNISYPNYGARGIKVCDKWEHDFYAFAKDMGEKPHGCSIERIDNEKGYSPDNCRWATRTEQSLNTRRSVKLFVNGEQIIPSKIARDLGMKLDTIVNRAKRGLSLDKVCSKENLRDLSGLALGGKANGLRQKSKTHCPNGHEYSFANVLSNPHGWRRCKICHAKKERERNAIKKLAK